MEKGCHFFDLFRLIVGKEVRQEGVQALAQRGVNYLEEDKDVYPTPIIDAAYVLLPFENGPKQQCQTMGCLELCMFAEGSRHQEEIIVTGTKVRQDSHDGMFPCLYLV